MRDLRLFEDTHVVDPRSDGQAPRHGLLSGARDCAGGKVRGVDLEAEFRHCQTLGADAASAVEDAYVRFRWRQQ
jgi:hypothetical protein